MAETIGASENSDVYMVGVGEELVYNATLASGSATLTPKASTSATGTFSTIDDDGSAAAYTASTGWRTLKGSSRAPLFIRFDNSSGGTWTLEVA